MADGTFQIEVINRINPAEPVVYHVNAVEGQNLYQSMCALRDKPGSTFAFESYEVVEHPGQHFISSINGLREDRTKSLYWKIYKGSNPTASGVDFIYPKQDKKYMFVYDLYPDGHDIAMRERRVTFTIEVINLVNPSPKVIYENVKAVDEENLYTAIRTLEEIPGCGFTFERTDLTETIGHFITSINGLDEVPKNCDDWTIRKGDLDNWMPKGVSWIHPKQGEKYIFAYTHTLDDHANRMRTPANI